MVVAPKMMPFQFIRQLLREGMRASVSCSVIEGDRPFEFNWDFEGKSISPHSNSASVQVRLPIHIQIYTFTS